MGSRIAICRDAQTVYLSGTISASSTLSVSTTTTLRYGLSTYNSYSVQSFLIGCSNPSGSLSYEATTDTTLTLTTTIYNRTTSSSTSFAYYRVMIYDIYQS